MIYQEGMQYQYSNNNNLESAKMEIEDKIEHYELPKSSKRKQPESRKTEEKTNKVMKENVGVYLTLKLFQEAVSKNNFQASWIYESQLLQAGVTQTFINSLRNEKIAPGVFS